LISDIDDIIKHSAIASGAKEVFTNTFMRELQDLTIQGVKGWYTKLHSLVVKLHYVSNSPWQLYPLLRGYFSLTGLPPGSFHLKHYSGMLQGIFEPAAERKRGSLDRIMVDFPERRFVPVGDSGEADLEVYTDVVMANPGRVLAVYIRDVTTPDKKFFDQAISNVGPDARTRSNGSRDHYSHSSASDDPEARPSLPERRNALSESGHESTPLSERLNNFEDKPDDLSTRDILSSRSAGAAGGRPECT
jgi:phosphatidate phosphatase APP1